MKETAAIFEMDTERDRKTCITLFQKAEGANRNLAQWLLDHPRYYIGISLSPTFLRHRRFLPPSPFFECYRNQPVELFVIEVSDRSVEVTWQNIP